MLDSLLHSVILRAKTAAFFEMEQERRLFASARSIGGMSSQESSTLARLCTKQAKASMSLGLWRSMQRNPFGGEVQPLEPSSLNRIGANADASLLPARAGTAGAQEAAGKVILLASGAEARTEK